MVIADDHSNVRHRDVMSLWMVNGCKVLVYGLQTAGLIT
jgi:hypothetical protein